MQPQSQREPSGHAPSHHPANPPAGNSELTDIQVLRHEDALGVPAFPGPPGGVSWDDSIDLPGVAAGSRSGFPRLLAFADVAGMAMALALTVAILLLMGREPALVRVVLTLLLMVPAWFAIAYVSGLYSLAELRISHGVADEISKVIVAVTAWSWLLLVIRSVVSDHPGSMLGPVLLWVIAIPMTLAVRAAARTAVRRRHRWRSPIAIVGSTDERSAIRERISRHPEWGLEIKADLDLDEPVDVGDPDPSSVLTGHGVRRVIVAGG